MKTVILLDDADIAEFRKGAPYEIPQGPVTLQYLNGRAPSQRATPGAPSQRATPEPSPGKRRYTKRRKARPTLKRAKRARAPINEVDEKIPPVKKGTRRTFSDAVKKQILAEIKDGEPGQSAHSVAKRHGIAHSVVLRWMGGGH